MPKIELKNKDVAARFEANVEKDMMIHTKGYSGKLSGINIAGAENILKDKNINYLVEKGKAKSEKPADLTPPK